MREYRYRVDRDGRIFHDETEVVDPHVLAFFVRAMRRTEDGRYLVMCQGEQNWFEAADTPLVIQRIGTPTADGGAASIELYLPGSCRETLDAATLEARGDQLYCRVGREALLARFGRTALQQLAPMIGASGDELELRIGDHRHAIRRATGEPR